jgi:shikimate kinase
MAETPGQDLPSLIVLIGMKHCGKSTVGRELADRIDAAFFDSDSLLEDLQARTTGQKLTCREIYRRLGKQAFQDLEAKALREFLDAPAGSDRRVLALGGATPLNPSLPESFRRPAPRSQRAIVHLDVSPETLWQRVRKTGLPAFVDRDDPKGSFLGICRRRRGAYCSLADATVQADAMDVPHVVRAVLSLLESAR